MRNMNPFSSFPFVPLERVSGQNWQRPPSFAFATTLAHLPLADSEVLQTAHHLPIVVAETDDGLHVVALLHAGLTRIPPVGEDGRWRRSYMPIALRCLPFRLASPPGASPRLEIAPDLGIAPPGAQTKSGGAFRLRRSFASSRVLRGDPLLRTEDQPRRRRTPWSAWLASESACCESC